MHILDDTLALTASEFLDDGRKLMGPNGPYDQHAVDAPVIGVDVSGTGAALVGWQNGTEGDIYGRSFTEVDGLGPAQPLAGGPYAAQYAGTLALDLSAAADGSAVSAQKVLLDEEPGLFTVVMPGALLSCPTDDEREDDDVLADASAFLEGGHARGMICADDTDVFDLGPVAAGCTIDAELLFETDDGDLDLYLHTHAEQTTEAARGFSASDNEFLEHDVVDAASFTLRVEGYGSEENAYILRAMVTCP
ncbi:MAG: hypothetical protein GY822_03550 [Deltaproteobacteria bacterium]|nr:hypothetical protein [Deltaproteobacteria bacterium]